jgi:hypothetical protein|tara:strand:- start:598 stop:888 length:291 start_codon:yes stop_codon:yes gene_type:complete
MQKFLNIKGASSTNFQGSQLVALNGLKTLRAATATATTTVLDYEDGTSTTITTAAQTAFNVQVQLQEAVEAALATSWVNPVYDVTLVLAPTSIVNA